MLNKFKSEILNRSDMYQFYKNENKQLKKTNKSLKNKLKELKLQFDNKDMLIKSLINNEDFNENSLNYCPICNSVVKFKPFGIVPRNNALCPSCDSLERLRFVFLAMKEKFPNIFDKNCKMLHFAPELPFYNYFNKINTIDYCPVDFNQEIYEKRNIHIKKKINMETITFDDKTLYICTK